MKSTTTLIDRFKTLVLIILYYSLIIYYGHFIESTYNAVEGFSKLDFNLFYYLLNLLPVAIYSLLFPVKMSFISDYLVFFIILFINLPLGYFCLIKLDSYVFSLLIVMFNFSWFILWLLLRKTFFYLPKNSFKISIKNIVLLLLFSSVFYFLYANGLGFEFYEKREIYRVRDAFKSQDIGFVLRYLFSLMQYSIIPLIILVAVRVKSKILKLVIIAIAIVSAFSIFSSTALKSSLFVLFFILIGYLVSRWKLNTPSRFLILINSFIIFLMVFSQYSSILHELHYHTLRRVFYSPVKTGVLAYDFFINHCNECGLFNGIGNNVGHTLSEYYFNLDGNSTTGFLANSFLNGGVIKTFINIVILIITLKLIDTVTRKVDLKYGLVVFIVFGYVLSNTALSSTLVSYGLILSIITFNFLKKWLQTK